MAETEGLVSHNPATELHDLPLEEQAPRGLSPDAVEWLFRVASDQKDKTARARDMALLTLLSDCGLRSQEAADLQLRDLDLRAETLTVRAGKGRKPRRFPIVGESVRRLRDYLGVRCPSGLPPIGSDAEREPLLIAQQRAEGTVSWRPGMQTVTMRKRLSELGQEAITRIATQIKREASLERIGELEQAARELGEVSPHRLRHGLATGCAPAVPTLAISRASWVISTLPQPCATASPMTPICAPRLGGRMAHRPSEPTQVAAGLGLSVAWWVSTSYS